MQAGTSESLRKLGGVSAQQPSTMRENNGLVIVTMGPSGAGKTTLLETLLPKYGPIAIADVDGKAHVLRDNPNIDVFPCHDWETLDKIVEDLLKTSLHPHYKTFVVDGTTMMQVGLAYKKHNVDKIDNPQVRMGAYGRANSDMLDIGARVRILAERGMNIIYNIWSIREKDAPEEGGASHVQPDLTPTMLTRFLGVLDFVVYIETAAPPNKPYPPIMRTGGSQVYATRTAISPDSPLRDMPALIYNPSYTSILDCYHGNKWPIEKHTK